MDDTHPLAAEKMRELMAKKMPGERVAHCCSMFSFARELAIAKMLQDGDLTQAQLRQRLFLHFYGREFDEDQRLKILAHLESVA